MFEGHIFQEKRLVGVTTRSCLRILGVGYLVGSSISAKDLSGFSKWAKEIGLSCFNDTVHFWKTALIFSWTCYQQGSINRYITVSSCILKLCAGRNNFPIKKPPGHFIPPQTSHSFFSRQSDLF